jgi:hypothetical protein
MTHDSVPIVAAGSCEDSRYRVVLLAKVPIYVSCHQSPCPGLSPRLLWKLDGLMVRHCLGRALFDSSITCQFFALNLVR